MAAITTIIRSTVGQAFDGYIRQLRDGREITRVNIIDPHGLNGREALDALKKSLETPRQPALFA